MTTLVIAPRFDPTGTVRVEIDADLREVVVTDEGEFFRYVLAEREPDRLGWMLHHGGKSTSVRVADVVNRCLRDWDAEQAGARPSPPAGRPPRRPRAAGAWP